MIARASEDKVEPTLWRITPLWSWLTRIRDDHQWNCRSRGDGDQNKKSGSRDGDRTAVGVSAHDISVCGYAKNRIVGNGMITIPKIIETFTSSSGDTPVRAMTPAKASMPIQNAV